MAVGPSIPASAAEAPVTQDAERLTAVLRRCGVLGDGRVCGVEAETLPTLISRVSRLRLTYDGAVDAPGSIILKAGIRGRSGGLWEPGNQKSSSTVRSQAQCRRRSFRAASRPSGTRPRRSGTSYSKTSPNRTSFPPHGRCRRRWRNANRSCVPWRASMLNGGTILALASPSGRGPPTMR